MSTSRTLIIGGTSGIGLATADLLADGGAEVHVAGRDPDRVRAVAAEHPRLQGHVLDAADAAAVAGLAAGIAPVDALILTLSGAEGIGPFAELDLDMLRHAFDAKFWPQATALQASLPHLSPSGSITLIGAITAHAAMPGTAGIAAVNAAVEALVRPLAVELSPRRVNAISPGFVDTPWWSTMPDADREAYFASTAETLPTRQIATPEQIAEVVALAATNANLTGAILPTDGGLSLVTLPS